MKKNLTLCARSPMGFWIALCAVTAILLFFGLEIAHQAMDGVFYTKVQPTIPGTARPMPAQQSINTFLTTVTDRMKKYDKPDLLTKYGIAIFVGFACVGILGGLIRTYRFRFRPGGRGGNALGGIVERRSMWIFIPVAWLARLWRRTWTIIPVRGLRNLPIPLIDLYIPGLRKRVPASRIKRLEIQAGSEGGTALVLTFRDERSWVLSRGRQKRLQRLGSVAARTLGLERRDLLTWS